MMRMKKTRAFLMAVLVTVSICVLSGCATTNHDSYTVIDNSSGLEKKQPSPTEDMTAIQKTGYFLGWYSLVGLYAWAGGGVPLSPP
jgi:hypothetical protein